MTQPVDALRAIRDDLRHCRRSRGRHYLPALVLGVAVVGVVLVTLGLRRDLWHQSGPQLSAQVGLWVLALLVFPAVGLGIVFLRPWARTTLIVAAALAVLVSLLGWPPDRLAPSTEAIDGAAMFHGCSVLVLVAGALLLLIGSFSGALVERRCPRSTYWIAAAAAIAAFNTASWVCAGADPEHVVFAHLGATVVLAVLVVACARWLRRAQDRE